MRRLIITSVLSSLLMGPAMVCAAPADGAYVAGRPAAAPIRASTGFDSALRCMDDLLARSQYGNGINLYATDLQDLSAVGAATRDMIVAAAARLSEKSRFFTVHPATGGPPPAGAISLVARGSITQYDKAVTGQGTGGGGSLGVTGVGGRQQKQSSVLTVTLYFLDPSGALVPGTVQTVSMALMTTNNGADVTAEIGQFGGFFELEFSRSDGPHQAVKTLIDLAMAQAVGGYAQIPVYRCLAASGTDPLAIQQARRTFDKMKPPEQILAIAKALSERELLSEPPTATLDPKLRLAIADYEAQQGLPPLGLPSFEVYYALYQTAYGVTPAVQPTGMKPGPGIKVAPFGPGFMALGDQGYAMVIGDRLSFAVTLARTGHVVCYHTDGDKLTTRVFPNRERVGDRLQAGETLIIPGPLDIYTIEPRTPNTVEWVTCLAAPQPFLDRLPPGLRVQLEPGAKPAPVSGPDEIVALARQANIEGLAWDLFPYAVQGPPSPAPPPGAPPQARPPG